MSLRNTHEEFERELESFNACYIPSPASKKRLLALALALLREIVNRLEDRQEG